MTMIVIHANVTDVKQLQYIIFDKIVKPYSALQESIFNITKCPPISFYSVFEMQILIYLRFFRQLMGKTDTTLTEIVPPSTILKYV